mmetsp:Transcript_48113/g.124737  ORF Transcript_48113/g.124737 Transcript_48113/m.124737 type:complete len:287 (-) Transcript_48113:339-1199(-)
MIALGRAPHNVHNEFHSVRASRIGPTAARNQEPELMVSNGEASGRWAHELSNDHGSCWSHSKAPRPVQAPAAHLNYDPAFAMLRARVKSRSGEGKGRGRGGTRRTSRSESRQSLRPWRAPPHPPRPTTRACGSSAPRAAAPADPSSAAGGCSRRPCAASSSRAWRASGRSPPPRPRPSRRRRRWPRSSGTAWRPACRGPRRREPCSPPPAGTRRGPTGRRARPAQRSAWGPRHPRAAEARSTSRATQPSPRRPRRARRAARPPRGSLARGVRRAPPPRSRPRRSPR